MEYILEIKQVVDYPRIRIHRSFIQQLMADRRLGRRSGCHLFDFLILSSYANFRTTRKYVDGVRQYIKAGEWICSLADVSEWFQVRSKQKVLDILAHLSKLGLLSHTVLCQGKMVHYKIANWSKYNTALNYECRCPKDSGFYFFPIAEEKKLLASGRCSEADALMDMWVNTIYKDECVTGSDLGPVVYFRTGTGDPLTSYADMATRWNVSKATAGRMVRKLDDCGYLTGLNFPGRHGSVYYLNGYLSTMFEICDLPVDKEEVALCFKIRLDFADQEPSVSVPEQKICVSNSIIRRALPQILRALSMQGFVCCECPQKMVSEVLLSACPPEGIILHLTCCRESKWKGQFEIRVLEMVNTPSALRPRKEDSHNE